MRIHCIAAIITTITGLYLQISAVEWCLIAIAIGNVLSKETSNSALEDIVDLCCTDHKPKARNAKDKAAGAVLDSAIFAVIVGLIIFVPKISALYA